MCQASLSFTISQSLLKLTSIESVIPSNHLILCHPLLRLPSIFPSSGSFPMSRLFPSSGQSIGASASISVFSMNIQDQFPLGWTGWISLQSKGLSRVSPTPQFKSINSSALSFLYKKEMATHSSVLAWRIPGTAEPAGLPSISRMLFIL